MQTVKANTKTIHGIYSKKVKEPLEYNKFRDVIQDFHKEITQRILDGYKFHPYSKIGVFGIMIKYRQKRNGKYIDWNKSNKRKAEILARNGILYQEWWELNGVKLEENINVLPEGAIKVNNAGEKWMIHFNDAYYFNWIWWKDNWTKYTRHIRKYKFIPTRFNKRQISTISNRTDSPEIIYVTYTEKSK